MTLTSFYCTIYILIGLFTAHHIAHKTEKDFPDGGFNHIMLSIGLIFIVALWPLYYIYKLFKH